MKIFAFIMALTILALSVMPCVDGSLSSNGKANTEFSKTENQKEHSNTDDCSPFCTCSCCSASVIYQTLAINYFHKPVFQSEKYPALKSPFYSDISLSIWQPPKLA